MRGRQRAGMSRDRGRYDFTPRPGNFNTRGTREEARRIERQEAYLEFLSKLHKFKVALYNAGKCDGCNYLDRKQYYWFGAENKVCDNVNADKCPHQFKDSPESKVPMNPGNPYE